MKITIEFQTENAAFIDDYDFEVGYILKTAVNRITEGAPEGHLRDTNGNKVGTFTVEQ